MKTIKNSTDFSKALGGGHRFFSLVGPRGKGKVRNLLDQVREVNGRTTLPEPRNGDHAATLHEQVLSALPDAGSDGNKFGFILVMVAKEHFDLDTQAYWNDPVYVKNAYYDMLARVMERVSTRMSPNQAVIFNFDDAPFASSVSFGAVNKLPPLLRFP